MMVELEIYTNWNDVICPICLDFPHNSVLLQCSSFEKGCLPLVCDTNHLHSNCLERFKQANGIAPDLLKLSSTDIPQITESESDTKPACPLCRGEVTGWTVVDKARTHLDKKKRFCEEDKCPFLGTYFELQKHVQVEHPHACPSKIDPARKIDWEYFQQSSEIIDVLSTIHSEIPRGVVLGDYIIEYGDDNSGDDFDDFPGNEGNWWTSCILYQVFHKFRMSRNRRRSRVVDSRRGNRRFSFDTTSNSDEGSVENVDYRADEADDDFVTTARELSRGRVGQRSYRRHRSRFYDN